MSVGAAIAPPMARLDPQPNLFLIGGMRCGSTTLHLMLGQHPAIFMSPVKEPYYYVAEALRRRAECGCQVEKYIAQVEAGGKHRTAETYSALFREVRQERWIGESSHYLYHPQVIEPISSDAPSARIVVSLRDPVERIFSEYLLSLRTGTETGSFRSFVERCRAGAGECSGRASSIGAKLDKGFQCELLKPWIDRFGEDNIRCVLFEDFEREPRSEAQSLFSWLGIDANITPTVLRTQRGGLPKRRAVIAMLNRQGCITGALKKRIPRMIRERARAWVYARVLDRPEMDREIRSFLMSLYRDDVRKLEQLIKRDLSGWLVPA